MLMAMVILIIKLIIVIIMMTKVINQDYNVDSKHNDVVIFDDHADGCDRWYSTSLCYFRLYSTLCTSINHVSTSSLTTKRRVPWSAPWERAQNTLKHFCFQKHNSWLWRRTRIIWYVDYKFISLDNWWRFPLFHSWNVLWGQGAVFIP